MQLPEPPPPPLTSLWDRILRANALPPDLDVQLLYVAIRDRLIHPEWEVRLHALRVLADLLPISGNALAFPFDEVVDNLGHNSPNVRKAALDALKVFCSYCEEPECAARAILDKCSYENIRPHSANVDAKANVITGLILSIPSVIGILKRRNPSLNVYPMFVTLGEKLFDSRHKDVALRSLVKLRRVCGPRDYMAHLKQLDPEVQDKFRQLCEMYDDEDSNDVYYAPKKSSYRTFHHQIVRAKVFNGSVATPLSISSDSSEDSFNKQFYRNNFGKIIIETEIKFDSDTAITMTVLEESETEAESDRKSGSEDDFYSSDHNALKYSDGDADSVEDPDVVVKKVRFGGESVKIRTPDSENQVTSEDDKPSPTQNDKEDNIKEVTASATPVIVSKMNELKSEAIERESLTSNKCKKSGIPLPVIQAKSRSNVQSVPLAPRRKIIKQKSKSLSELYDYFQTKNGMKPREETNFALTLIEVRSPQKILSPVDPHREIEVLHNLQRSPVVSPRRTRTRFLADEHYGLATNHMAFEEPSMLSPRAENDYRLRARYDWEDFGIVPDHITEQLHNQENWISAVKAADQLHSALLDPATVKALEPAALSLVQHMWALSDAVSAAKAPAEGAVCAVFRSASNDCARALLPALVSRMAREPLPAALPHALLQRLALHHLVDLIFDPYMIGVSGDMERLQTGQLRAALCLARAAGPAAVLSAVRRRLAGTTRADVFCQKLRDLFHRPINNTRASQIARSSQLPVPVRRRARSTPPPAAPLPPRRLRPLPDSAPLPGASQARKEHTLMPIPFSDRDSSATTASLEPDTKQKIEDDILSHKSIIGEVTEVEITDEDNEEPPPPPRSPSIYIEDYAEKSKDPSINGDDRQSNAGSTLKDFEDKVFGESESPLGSRKSLDTAPTESPAKLALSRASSPSPVRSVKSGLSSPAKSRANTPAPASEPYHEEPAPIDIPTRDVRAALSECIVPARHEDWEVIVNALLEIERLAADSTARAPTASWRSIVRSTAGHVRSLRSRVARTACGSIGALFEHRGRVLDPELEEAMNALLERCADVNRFLRADAAAALVKVACGGSSVRSIVALSRKGSTNRAGPIRAAATQALAKLVQHHGAGRILDFPPEPRTVVLRAAGELLGDANADTREQARQLCLALGQDMRFKPLLKESMPATRYKAVEKYVDRLRCR